MSTDQKPLEPDAILTAEYEYIAQSAFQANEDRARVASFYFVSVGSLVAAMLSTQFAGGLSPYVYLAFSLLFAILTVLGALTVAQLARLRAAWHSAALAMNEIKEYYIDYFPELAGPITWRKPPEKYKHDSIANMLTIQVALLSAITFGASVYTLFRSWGDVSWWGWLLVSIFAAFGYIAHRVLHKHMLEK